MGLLNRRFEVARYMICVTWSDSDSSGLVRDHKLVTTTSPWKHADHNFKRFISRRDNAAMACYLPSYDMSPAPAVQMLDSFRKASSSSSKAHPHKSVDSPRRRKGGSRGRKRGAKPILSPLADFATRLVLHDNDSILSNHGQNEEAIGGSSDNPLELDFPEIKWVLEDENEDNIFPFRFKEGRGSPEGFLVDLLYQEQEDPRVIQSCLTLRKQRRSTRCLFRSKTVRRDLTGTFNH